MDLIQIGGPPAQHGPDGGFEIDPVCGMHVEPVHAAGKWEYRGKIYYFCARSCLERFKKEPGKYLSGEKRSQSAVVDAGAKYTCPMHPEVVQMGPGPCPKCGMALEPMMPVAEEGPDPELVDMQRRLWLGGTLALPVFLIAM